MILEDVSAYARPLSVREATTLSPVIQPPTFERICARSCWCVGGCRVIRHHKIRSPVDDVGAVMVIPHRPGEGQQG